MSSPALLGFSFTTCTSVWFYRRCCCVLIELFFLFVMIGGSIVVAGFLSIGIEPDASCSGRSLERYIADLGMVTVVFMHTTLLQV